MIDLDAAREGHEVRKHDPTRCMCGAHWPCVTVTLADEVARLQKYRMCDQHRAKLDDEPYGHEYCVICLINEVEKLRKEREASLRLLIDDITFIVWNGAELLNGQDEHDFAICELVSEVYGKPIDDFESFREWLRQYRADYEPNLPEPCPGYQEA